MTAGPWTGEPTVEAAPDDGDELTSARRWACALETRLAEVRAAAHFYCGPHSLPLLLALCDAPLDGD